MPVTNVPYPEGVQQTEQHEIIGNAMPERRRRVRLPLRLPVCLFREEGREPVNATTVNVSSDGFYCVTDANLETGEVMGCLLVVPTHDPYSRERKTALDCRVRVVRVSNLDIERMYGVACHIEDYHFIPPQAK